MVKDPETPTYASVVSQESIRIALTLVALNDLEVKSSDVENAYLTAPCSERIWTHVGHKLGVPPGTKALIVRALYGLKSAGASFQNHISDGVQSLGWTPCLADPDVYLKPEVRSMDGYKY